MKKVRLCKIVVLTMFLACWSYSQLAVVESVARRGPLSPLIPKDVGVRRPAQADLDDFAWRVFIALNWPTKHGQSDGSKIIGQSPKAPRVWELFTDPINIFKDSDVKTLASALSLSQDVKTLYMTRKRVEKISGAQDVQAAPRWPLVDQKGNFATYEIRINDLQKKYIVSNNLTTPAGIEGFGRPIKFPVGSIEVKAAWRLFPENTPREILARYHTREAVIAIDADQSSTGKAFQIKGTVGLVGLHIVYKTEGQPKWTWATFEHVDNYEIYYKPLPGLKPTFSSGNKVSDASNRQPTPKPEKDKYLWSTTQPTARKYHPTEVARCPNEVTLPSALNSRWQETLAGVAGVENSPWQYYRLNAIQWFDARDRLQPKNTDGVAVSRNSVLETYLLGDQTIASQVPAILPVNSDPDLNPSNSTLGDTVVATILASESPEKTGEYTWSSCVLCHQMALYQYGPDAKRDNVMTDYSFIFRSYLPAGGKK